MVRYDIVDAIRAHADNEGSGYQAWYCGIASNPKNRLFTDHGVPEQNAWWIHRSAQTEKDARDTEARLLELGFDGGGGGGDFSTIHLYAYKKTPETKP